MSSDHLDKKLNMTDTLKRLADIVDARKQAVKAGEANGAINAENSYIAKLFSKGDDAILKKIGEEAAETVMAAKDCRYTSSSNNSITTWDASKQASLVGEVADLWFHCLLALSQFDLRPEDVLKELERREGTSGIAEKAARKS
jgi:phosphoribosyl-ATP pyrophosphohydrolase